MTKTSTKTGHTKKQYEINYIRMLISFNFYGLKCDKNDVSINLKITLFLDITTGLMGILKVLRNTMKTVIIIITSQIICIEPTSLLCCGWKI